MTEAEALQLSPIVMLLIGAISALLFFGGLAMDIYLLVRLGAHPPDHKAIAARLRSFPWTLREGALLLGILALLNSALIALAMLGGKQDPEPGEHTLALSIATQGLFFHGAGVLVIAGLMLAGRKSWKNSFGINPARIGRDIARGFLYYLAAIPPLVICGWLYRLLLMRMNYDIQPQGILKIFVSPDLSGWFHAYLLGFAIIAAPFAEELVFRGVALPALSRRMKLWQSVLLTSLLFSLLHFHVPSFAALFVIATAFSLAYVMTGSIVVPMAMHAAFNGVNLAIVMILKDAQPFG